MRKKYATSVLRSCLLAIVLLFRFRRPTSFPLKTAIHGELWDRNLLFRRKVVKLRYINPQEMEMLKVDFEPQQDAEKKIEEEGQGLML